MGYQNNSIYLFSAEGSLASLPSRPSSRPPADGQQQSSAGLLAGIGPAHASEAAQLTLMMHDSMTAAGKRGMRGAGDTAKLGDRLSPLLVVHCVR